MRTWSLLWIPAAPTGISALLAVLAWLESRLLGREEHVSRSEPFRSNATALSVNRSDHDNSTASWKYPTGFRAAGGTTPTTKVASWTVSSFWGLGAAPGPTHRRHHKSLASSLRAS